MDLWQGLKNIIMNASFEVLTPLFLKLQLFCYETLFRGLKGYRKVEGTTFRNVCNCFTGRHSVTSHKTRTFVTMGIQLPGEALSVLSVWAHIFLSKWTLQRPIVLSEFLACKVLTPLFFFANRLIC